MRRFIISLIIDLAMCFAVYLIMWVAFKFVIHWDAFLEVFWLALCLNILWLFTAWYRRSHLKQS